MGSRSTCTPERAQGQMRDSRQVLRQLLHRCCGHRATRRSLQQQTEHDAVQHCTALVQGHVLNVAELTSCRATACRSTHSRRASRQR